MEHCNTVIFDLDGTLLDTIDDLADSVNAALKLFGFPLRTVAEVNSFVGNGVGRLMELSVPDGKDNPSFEGCFAAFRRHYMANMRNKTAPYAGIPALLARLKAKGCKLAVVSNKLDPAVKVLCRHYFGDLIDLAAGETAGTPRKPAPEIVFRVMEELGSSAEKTLYVGDSDVDVMTAHNAHLPCAGAAWGFRGRGALEACGADYVIDRPAELLVILGRA